MTLAQQLAVGIALAALVPLAFFRYSRSLWLSVDYLTSADGGGEPGGRAGADSVTVCFLVDRAGPMP